MPRYRVYLRDRTGRILARENVEAVDVDEAADIAAVLCDACSDVSAYFEVWDGNAKLPSPGLPVRLPDAFELSDRAQQIVIDREIALQDSNRRLHESKALLKKLDDWIVSSKATWNGIEARAIEFR
ncbi:MAG TPA: hypothetical protein VMU22_11985 [Rhizomicrobium sp.]|nr:hypothetical protein [Rhizomicrobium sp.]